MIEKNSAWLQQPESRLKVCRQLSFANVLHHADAYQFVEFAELSRITIIQQPDFAARLQAGFLDPFLSKRQLLLAERDAGRMNSIISSGMKDEATPTASDVE